MEHAEAVKLIKDYGFAVLKHQNNWLGDAYEALLRALLSASIADTAKPVIDKSMVKRLMVQHGLDKSHESIADTAEAKQVDEKSSGLVYQIFSHRHSMTACWEDVPKEFYDRTHDSQRRILYPVPVPAPPAPPAPSVADAAGASEAERFLTENDMAALFMFVSQCEDSEADGYTARKETMKRLAELGCVESKGFGRYAPTMFGLWLIDTSFEQNPSLPLLTRADYNAKSAKESGND